MLLRYAFMHMLVTLIRLIPWLLLTLLVAYLLALPRMGKAGRRRRLLRRLEEKRGSRVIAMIHRGGGPLQILRGGGSIGIFEAETILKIIRETPPEKPIDLLLHTPGGLILSSVQIARALQNHPAPVRAIIPFWAMSGGTLLSLAADEIIMDRNAVLGPIDPQSLSLNGQVAMASVLRVIREKSKDEIEDRTWIMADQAEKVIRELQEQIAGLLAKRLGPERAQELATRLTEGNWTHSYPFSVAEVEAMGLSVSTDVPKEAYELLEAFPQGSRFRSVQWLPRKKSVTQEMEGGSPWP